MGGPTPYSVQGADKARRLPEFTACRDDRPCSAKNRSLSDYAQAAGILIFRIERLGYYGTIAASKYGTGNCSLIDCQQLPCIRKQFDVSMYRRSPSTAGEAANQQIIKCQQSDE
ncbi:hypothetical protein T310_3304 [Rasamsonia emersonii CBS 393.64]|uniref:Uncharacterized protein n=1 Tax=Rasamsonia emersonii (strain ATCC 16479 / CBS 393.64 / IMI 116815) TaxID=1408163 RepID=A0A0F4YX82_RASE3|nr:hypothetical protein T310_3304 [Rasamsonia emersonii CBS 393.64]KKA22685.1 hypothetical protein T310_3304 [Rasamsonia emersonii CBS 393.64]